MRKETYLGPTTKIIYQDKAALISGCIFWLVFHLNAFWLVFSWNILCQARCKSACEAVGCAASPAPFRHGKEKEQPPQPRFHSVRLNCSNTHFHASAWGALTILAFLNCHLFSRSLIRFCNTQFLKKKHCQDQSLSRSLASSTFELYSIKDFQAFSWNHFHKNASKMLLVNFELFPLKFNKIQ